jgi:hypothetical protein
MSSRSFLCGTSFLAACCCPWKPRSLSQPSEQSKGLAKQTGNESTRALPHTTQWRASGHQRQLNILVYQKHLLLNFMVLKEVKEEWENIYNDKLHNISSFRFVIIIIIIIIIIMALPPYCWALAAFS